MAMLTPNKIKGYQFQQAGRGTYRAEEVDDFLGQIVESYEQVFKENGELVKKLSILATKLDEYRKEETSVRKALANAQNFIDKLVEDANNEAKKVVSEAQERAKNVDSITNAKIKVMVDEVEGKMRIAYDKATAQAKQTKDNARAEAETILIEAREKAERMIANAKRDAAEIISGATSTALKDAEELKIQIEKEKELLDKLKETSNQFKTELVVLYERQIKTVEQMPDYVLDKQLEETVKQIVDESKATVLPQEDIEIVEDEPEEDFDADDLINEYAVKDENADDGFTSALDIDEEDTEESSENLFSFELDEEVVATIEKEVEDAVEKEIGEEIEKREIEIEEKIEKEMEETAKDEDTEGFFDFDFDVTEEKEEDIEYEDVFSDSGNSEGFRFTAEDFDDINRSMIAEDVKEDDIDFFSEETEDDGIYVGRSTRQRKLDIAFSDEDAVEIEKDEDLFLNQNHEAEELKVEQGFKLFDNIDFSDNESFDIANDDMAVDADDVFGKSDNDDDSEGFSFLRNIFGKNKD